MLAAGGLAPRCWKCCQQQPQVLRRAAMACAASARGLSATSSLGRNARTGASLLASNSRHSPSRLPGSSLPSLSLLGPSSDRDAPGLRSAQLSLGQRSAESRGASFDGLSFFSTWQRQKSSVARTTAKATRGRKKGLSGYPSLSGADGDEDDAAQRHRRKWDAIDDVISKVNDDFGKGTVVPLDAKGPISDVEFFSTGILPLDLELQGGWPVGRIVEIYGHESSGKTSLALYAIAEMQRRKEAVVLIDAEHAMDMQYAKRLGVVTEGRERLILVQPNSGEQAINVADTFIRSGQVSLIVIDSVSALIPQQELEGLAGEGALGSLARLMSQAMRRLSPAAAKAKCTVIFINQIRNKIGVYGNPETTSGGVALKFHASVRCEMKVVERKRVGGEDLGFRVRVRVVKSKVSVPYKEAEFEMLHGHGVQHEGAVLDAAEKLSIISRRGAYYYYNGEVVQGREKMSAYLRENPEVLAGLEAAVREAIKAGGRPPMEAEASAPEEDLGLEDLELEAASVDLGLEEGSQ